MFATALAGPLTGGFSAGWKLLRRGLHARLEYRYLTPGRKFRRNALRSYNAIRAAFSQRYRPLRDTASR